MNRIGRLLVRLVEICKSIFRCRTYHVEGTVVLIALLLVVNLTDKDLVEYLGVAAVFFTFMHATIAEYMREAEAKREHETNQTIIACHKKLPFYFYAKELCWLMYFFLLGAHSALVGVFIFLLYQPWRKLWRTYHPM